MEARVLPFEAARRRSMRTESYTFPLLFRDLQGL